MDVSGMIYRKVNKSSSVPPDSLRNFIWDGIEKREKEDVIELILPWHFGNGDRSVPLVLTVRKIREGNTGADVQRMRAKGYSVDDGYYPYYEISDGGRCLEELKKRLGSIDDLVPKIKRILYDCGMLELKSGRIITKSYYAISSFYHTNALNQLLSAISILSNLDLLLAVDGEIRKGGELNGS